jgi:hypothetical protein
LNESRHFSYKRRSRKKESCKNRGGVVHLVSRRERHFPGCFRSAIISL